MTDETWETNEVNLWLNNEPALYDYMNMVLASLEDDDEAAEDLATYTTDIAKDFGDFCGLSLDQLTRVDWLYIVGENRE